MSNVCSGAHSLCATVGCSDPDGHDADESYLKPRGIGPTQLKQIEMASAQYAAAADHIEGMVAQIQTWDPDEILSQEQHADLDTLDAAISKRNAAVHTIRAVAPDEWLNTGSMSLEYLPTSTMPTMAFVFQSQREHNWVAGRFTHRNSVFDELSGL